MAHRTSFGKGGMKPPLFLLIGVRAFGSEGGAEGYILRKTDAEDRRRFLKNICSVLKLAVTDDKMVMRAIENSDFVDFEDNLQDCCAAYAGADYIVTVNKKDFEGHSGVTPLTPAEFVSLSA